MPGEFLLRTDQSGSGADRSEWGSDFTAASASTIPMPRGGPCRVQSGPQHHYAAENPTRSREARYRNCDDEECDGLYEKVDTGSATALKPLTEAGDQEAGAEVGDGIARCFGCG